MIEVVGAEVEFIPAPLRTPLKFGAEVTEFLRCARARMILSDGCGHTAVGWGETPLSAAWAWPSNLSFGERERVMCDYCRLTAEKLIGRSDPGHALELGWKFVEEVIDLPAKDPRMPYLARLVSASPFDLALHDAFGKLVGKDTFSTFTSEFMVNDLEYFFGEAAFRGVYPGDLFVKRPPDKLPVWHLVGGSDPLEPEEIRNGGIGDGYPESLREWIAVDGLRNLKIKLSGVDAEKDFARLVSVGKIALECGVENLCADFNCLAGSVAYVEGVLDRLEAEFPEIYRRLFYVEQPFAEDLDKGPEDVSALAARKPLFLDESAHDWREVRRGRAKGWNGVALKVCKTLSGALLSGCWGKTHDMLLMVQDLTNPMLAMIPHVRLAAEIGTIMGVECNAPQFYPAVSGDFELRHPGLYRRRNGVVDLSSLGETGLGYLPEDTAGTDGADE